MTTIAPYLLRCAPHLVSKVWGGHRLHQNWGKESLGDQPVGESWEVADLPQGQSRILNGAFAGRTLHEAVKAWGARLTGGEYERFPLLVKLLDANLDLSVQVHPGHEHLNIFGRETHSKDEAWLILESDEGEVLHGLKGETTKAQLEEALRDGDPVSLMRRASVKPGDVIHVPPGTIHAICSGVMLLEIQEPSDTTFRVYDYKRPGLDGNLRPLHLEEAMKVSRFGAAQQPPLFTSPVPCTVAGSGVTCSTLVVDAPYHILSFELEPGVEYAWHARHETPSVFVVLEGECEMDGEVLRRGESAIAPANLELVQWKATGEQGCRVIATYLAK